MSWLDKFKCKCKPLNEVAGTIRKNKKGWFFIDDDAHDPIGVSKVSANGSSIVIEFDKKYTKVVSFICGPDETLALDGFVCGASVGLDKVIIKASDRNGPIVLSDAENKGNIWFYGVFK